MYLLLLYFLINTFLILRGARNVVIELIALFQEFTYKLPANFMICLAD